MTIRTDINRRKRFLGLIISGGTVLFLLGAIVFHQLLFWSAAWVQIPGYIGFAFAFLAMAYACTFAFPCPNCRVRLGQLVMTYGIFSLDPQ